jgi:plastocyanin
MHNGLVRIVTAFSCLAIASCGGGRSPSTPSNPGTTNPYTFTLTSSSITPKELTVPAGSQVLFVNHDSRRHDMACDPHPEHNDPQCAAINDVGPLNPGESRETGNLVTVRTCGFHDHDNPPPTQAAGNLWTGKIIVR